MNRSSKRLPSLLVLLSIAVLPALVVAGEAGMITRQTPYPLEHNFNVVKAVQTELHKRGFDPGPVDGLFGPRTKSAVKSFQEKSKITPADGHIKDETVQRLLKIKPSEIPG